MVMMMARTCYWIPVGQYDEHGYMPSVVTEGRPGHVPCTGRPDGGPPWYWGRTYEEAVARCAKENEAIGVSAETAREIIRSSRAPVAGG